METYMKLAVMFTILWINGLAIQASHLLMVPLYGEGSHYSVMKRIAKEMLNRGHNITVLLNRDYEADVKAKDQHFNYEFFNTNFTRDEFHALIKNMTNAGLRGEYLTFVAETLSSDYPQRQASECLNILGDTELLSRLQNTKFDLAMVDFTVKCPIVQYLRQQAGLKYVVISPMLSTSCSDLLENRFPVNPSYMPGLTTGIGHRMSFLGRITNSALSLLMIGIQSTIANAYQSVIPKDVSLSHANAELWLVNTHFALDFPRPLMPNVIPVGGLTTGPASKLNHEWEEFLQSAGKDGVVLFSMGSYVRELGGKYADIFAGAFAQLPQKVIWKLNGKPTAALPPNVKVVDWIPQNDLLAHRQIKVFVNHAGLNGVYEAVYHGVPMVVMPLGIDAEDNAQRVFSQGIGTLLNFGTLTSSALAEAIREVINNPSYKRNATRLSAIFRDTPRTPVELAVDKLEYVIRHGGARHLRSAALDLNIFQYLLLDVILVLVVAVISFLIIAYCCATSCFGSFRKLYGQSSKLKSE